MKETRYFYVPDAASQTELPSDEAMHALRVLRLKADDEIFLMDGEGVYYRARITIAATHHCYYEIIEAMPQQRQWSRRIRLAIAPTKMLDRIEWMLEKATEIGVDEVAFVNCKFSERRVLKSIRLDKIVIAAMKQSHKAWKPVLNEMTDFKAFLQEIEQREKASGKTMQKFICHCYDDADPAMGIAKHVGLLKDVVKSGEDVLVMVGPEGDFSIDEVKLAEAKGFQGVSLGKSRLRTETAALVAVHIMNIINQ